MVQTVIKQIMVNFALMNKIILEQNDGGYGFEVKDENGHILKTDTSAETGGTNFGYRPMQLLLAALGSCSAIDTISILKKQKQSVDHLTITVEGERESGVIPSLWKSIAVTFKLTGDIDPDKAQKACDLSMQKYCSVAETLRRSGTSLTWQVLVPGSAEK